VFALEEGEGVYVAVEGESGEESGLATPAVEGGHGAGQRGVEEGRARVRRPVDAAFGVAEHFRLAQDSRMDFQAYFDLQLGYCAVQRWVVAI